MDNARFKRIVKLVQIEYYCSSARVHDQAYVVRSPQQHLVVIFVMKLQLSTLTFVTKN